MNWAELNAHENTKRDRVFQVILRPHQDGEQRTVVVKLKADELEEMARTGPLVPQMNAAALNRAQALPLGGFRWFDDPIVELH
jgi:hypothetical protein